MGGKLLVHAAVCVAHGDKLCIYRDIESLINTRTLKKRCALAACTEVKQTQEL